MIDFSKATFIKSCPSLNQKPEKNLPEICLVGKSNVGKSSLINALTKKKKLAFTSSKPGFTKLLNYYLIDDKFYIVDAPGYGFTASGNKHTLSFADMMEPYFDNLSLKGVLLLLDSRHKISDDDILMCNYILTKKLPLMIIMTKYDKLNQSEKAQMQKNIKNAFKDVDYYVSSINDEKLLNKIKEHVANLVIT